MKTEQTEQATQTEFTFLELDQQAKKQASTNFNFNYCNLLVVFETVIERFFNKKKNNNFFNEYVYPLLKSFVIQDFDYQKDLLQISFEDFVITNSPFENYIVNPFADRFCVVFLKWLKNEKLISKFKLNLIDEALNDNGIEIDLNINNTSNVTIEFCDVYNTFHCDNDLCTEIATYLNDFIKIINVFIDIIIDKCLQEFENLVNNICNNRKLKFNKYGNIILHSDEDSILNHYCDYMYRQHNKDFLFGCDGYDYYIHDNEYNTRHYLTTLKIHEIENTSDSDLFNIEFED